MPAISKSAVTGGVTKAEWYPDQGKRFEIRERVAATSTSNVVFLKLTQKLPPRCRIMAAELRHATAMSVGGSDATSTADRYALIRATSDAALSNIATNATISNSSVIVGSPTTSSGSLIRSIILTQIATAQIINTTTSEEFLYLAPIATQTATFRIGSVATTTVTNSYVFSGTGQYDVLVYGESYGQLEA